MTKNKTALHNHENDTQDPSRRLFIKQTAVGLATAGVVGLTLTKSIRATEPSVEVPGVEVPGYGKPVLNPPAQQTNPGPNKWSATEDNILGPYHRPGAPFRGKTTPPLAKGTILLIRGRIWSLATRKPIAGAILDIWHADVDGHYDNDGSAPYPDSEQFINRTSLVTNSSGLYEFEAIHPGRYKVGPTTWRPSHIHYIVRSRGHRPLVTQLYFKGDPYNATDSFIKKSLIIEFDREKVGSSYYEQGEFDIVLAPT